MVLRDRTARTVSLVIPSLKTEEIARQMLPVLSQDTVLCTDAYRGYKTVTKSAVIQHIALNQNKGEHSRGVYHIQNVNAYHSRLKGWMERFKGVSTKYLEYLGATVGFLRCRALTAKKFATSRLFQQELASFVTNQSSRGKMSAVFSLFLTIRENGNLTSCVIVSAITGLDTGSFRSVS